MMLTVCNTLFLLAYLLSAAVQYNDPDAWQWIAIYLAAAAMCFAHWRRAEPPWFPPLLLLVSVLWIFSLLPNIVGQVSLDDIFASLTMKTKAVEQAREIGGLVLVAIWAAVLTFQGRVRRSRRG